MVSQMMRAFRTAIEAEALNKNFMNKIKRLIARASEVEEATKKALLEVEALKKSQAEESVKLASTMSKIESLKKEVHLSKSEVASLTKWVETSNAHQKLTVEALDAANKENVAMKEQVGKLNSRVFGLVDEMETIKREAESIESEAEKDILPTSIWWKYAYIEVKEWIEANL